MPKGGGEDFQCRLGIYVPTWVIGKINSFRQFKGKNKKLRKIQTMFYRFFIHFQ